MTIALRYYLASVVAVSLGALIATTILVPVGSEIALQYDGLPAASTSETLLGLAFWIAVTLFASALPVRMPRGTVVGVSIGPLVAAMALGGPTAAGWIAAIGTTEVRELRGRIPWYGTLANHAVLVLPAIVGGVAADLVRLGLPGLLPEFLSTLVGAVSFFALNVLMTSTLVAIRSGQPVQQVLIGDGRDSGLNLVALAPISWLMSRIYLLPGAGWWATLLFALPLYTTRVAHHRVVAMRDMFTQTIGALAEAVDKRDPFTSKHSQRVKQIAVDIGREMRVNEAELEALEWGGLLHDVGKIGVPDAVLLKQERLTREERMIMNAHPVLGAQIIAPVTKLAPELPIIRHHHEWYNGSGYPDRLLGDEIPRLARILHVADAFEAMTAARPYRMTPLTSEQALAELRKFAGIQFDPTVVDAFVKTSWVDGVQDPGRQLELRPIPMIAQAASRMTEARAGQPER
jgi:putative nucleotidyltransferase with HDIG domain